MHSVSLLYSTCQLFFSGLGKRPRGSMSSWPLSRNSINAPARVYKYSPIGHMPSARSRSAR